MRAAPTYCTGGMNHALSAGHGLPGRDVLSFYEDHTGVLWLGVDNKLLAYEGGRFREIKSSNGQAIAGTSGISAINEDVDGNIWAMGNGRLFRIRDRRLRETIELSAEYRSSDGYLAARPQRWYVVHHSPNEIDPLPRWTIRERSSAKTESPASIHGLVLDSDETLLMPTSSGLFRLDNGHWTVLDTRNGLPCNQVFSVVKDRHGSLWLYSQCGLLRVEASEFRQVASRSADQSNLPWSWTRATALIQVSELWRSPLRSGRSTAAYGSSTG